MPNDRISVQQLESGRANYAFQEVKQAYAKLPNAESFTLYASYLKRLPSMIQVNGLGQALAFYYSKKKNKMEYERIYHSLSVWLIDHCDYGFLTKNNELIEEIVAMNSEEYRLVTVETLALVDWMKKFATGMSSDSE